MAQKETRVQKIVRSTLKHFPIFPARVDAERVVRFILAKRSALERAARQKIGIDARDILHTSELLEPLSTNSLGTIQHLKQREVRYRLKNKAYPFSRLNKKTREMLLCLPNSWIREATDWLLAARRAKDA